MLDALCLYGRYVSASLRSQMQYRASFAMNTLGIFFLTFTDFAVVWALFDRFGRLKGWTLAEVALLYGIIGVSFALCDMVVRGFDAFAGTIRRGEFDRLLLRPRSTALQVLGLEFRLTRIGRILQATLILVWAVHTLNVDWTVAHTLLLSAAILGGACLFAGLIILGATLCFWTVESTELINVLTHGGVETGQFPMSVYRPWFRRFFTYLVPVATAAYLPVHGLLGRTDPLGYPTTVYWCAPAAGVVFLLVCLRVWEFGVRHYTSTGS